MRTLRPGLSRRVAAAVAAVLMALSVTVFAGAGNASAASSSHGYTMEFHDAGLVAGGLKLYVKPGQTHSKVLAKYAKYAVRQIRKSKVPVTFGGWSKKNVSARAIWVIEVPNGCTRQGGDTIAHASPHYTTTDAGYDAIDGSKIVICTGTFRTNGVTRAILMHELGHAVGLGHYPKVYRGHLQIMNPQAQTEDVTYQAGDRAGLRRIAATSRRIAQTTPPQAKLTDMHADSAGTVDASGWAYFAPGVGPASHPQLRARLLVDDRAVATTAANLPLPSVQRSLHTSKHPGFTLSTQEIYGGHSYCVEVYATGVKAVPVGCRFLTYAPISSPGGP